MVLGWMFDGDGRNARTNCEEFSYKLGYLIAASLFRPVYPYRNGLSVPISEVYLHQTHYKLPSL